MPMMFNSQETQQESEQKQERRYDPDTLRKVTALATQLQHDHHERLTASQMESIGLEVGLEPEFIQQAIAQLEEEHARMEAERQRQAEEKQQSENLAAQHRKVQEQAVMTRAEQRLETSATKTEFYSVCAALAVPMLFGLMAYYFKSGLVPQPLLGQSVIAPRIGAMQLFTMIAPWPLALMQGFAAGKKRVGFIAAATLILALAPTVPFLAAASPEQYWEILRTLMDHVGEMFLYVMLALPVAGALGIAGAWIRQQYFPFPSGKSRLESNGQPVQHKEYTVSRPEMVSLLHNMQPAPGAYASPYMQAQQQPYLQNQMPSQMRRSSPGSAGSAAHGRPERATHVCQRGRSGAGRIAAERDARRRRLLVRATARLDRGDHEGQQRRSSGRSRRQPSCLLSDGRAGSTGRSPVARAVAAVQQKSQSSAHALPSALWHQRGRNRQ